MTGLSERGFAGEQLNQIRTMINGTESDLFDVLRYIAFTKAPLNRLERATARRDDILSNTSGAQAAFLEFILSQYVSQGEGELAPEKLPDLLELKYGTTADAMRKLGTVADLRAPANNGTPAPSSGVFGFADLVTAYDLRKTVGRDRTRCGQL